MTDSTKPRLDLEGLERHLTQTHQQGPAPKGNPLAELARIVGQDDPFHTLLADDRVPRGAKADPSGLDDLFVSRDGYGARQDYEPRPVRPREQGYGNPYALNPVDDGGAHGAPDHDGREARSLDTEDFGRLMEQAAAYETPYNQAGSEQGDGQEDFQLLEPRRSRKGLMLVAAALGVGALGVGTALTLRGAHTSSGPSGEPPVIQADTAPLKIQPQNPGGVEIPDQNKQIYEKARPESQTRVVDREEQPVDVRQAARLMTPSETPETGAAASAAPAQNGTSAALGEPRRVRTVSVKPDGSIAPNEPAGGGVSSAAPASSAGSAPPAPAPAPSSAPAAAASSSPSPAIAASPWSAPSASAASGPAPAPATPSGAASTPSASTSTPPAQTTSVLPPQRPRLDPRTTSTTTPTRSAAAASAPAQAEEGAPLQIAPNALRGAQKPAQKVASVPPASAAVSAAEPDDDASPTSRGGGFAVQLAVRNSDQEARAAFQEMQQRYAALGDRSASIQRANVKGQTLYRIRVGQLSRDEAASLCAKVKSSGGQCFVAKN